MKTLDAAREAEIAREARLWALQTVLLHGVVLAVGVWIGAKVWP